MLFGVVVVRRERYAGRKCELDRLGSCGGKIVRGEVSQGGSQSGGKAVGRKSAV